METSRTHAFNPFWALILGIVFLAAGFYVGTSYTVDAYLKTVANANDFAKTRAIRTGILQEIERRETLEANNDTWAGKRLKNVDKERLQKLINTIKEKNESEKRMLALRTDLAQAEIQLGRGREILSFFFWYFRMTGVLAALLVGIGTLICVKSLAVVRFPSKPHAHAHAKHTISRAKAVR